MASTAVTGNLPVAVAAWATASARATTNGQQYRHVKGLVKAYQKRLLSLLPLALSLLVYFGDSFEVGLLLGSFLREDEYGGLGLGKWKVLS